MEFSWLVLVVVAVVNILCLCAMFLAQALDKDLPPWGSTIPCTRQDLKDPESPPQKFLHMWDFWTMTWGDGVGVPLIVTGFVHLVMKDVTNLWWALPIMAVSAILFALMCLGKNHKPDWGFPAAGEISTGGILHLFYFGAGIAAALMCLWHLVVHNLLAPAWPDLVMWVALAGGVFYAGCFVLEVRSGNFDPLKKAPTPQIKNKDEGVSLS